MAKKCAGHGVDLPIAADQPELIEAARQLEQFGGEVEAIEVDLSAADGVDRLPSAGTGRTVDAKHRPWPRQRVRRLRCARARHGTDVTPPHPTSPRKRRERDIGPDREDR
ncbi:hypothetical protein [Reyranella sp.]|uniref:hypothetical protein n=1 Tax=Reyranella sp. TaxID=1929291 RepID=UPI003454444F